MLVSRFVHSTQNPVVPISVVIKTQMAVRIPAASPNFMGFSFAYFDIL